MALAFMDRLLDSVVPLLLFVSRPSSTLRYIQASKVILDARSGSCILISRFKSESERFGIFDNELMKHYDRHSDGATPYLLEH